jgi:hypothetical protein
MTDEIPPAYIHRLGTRVRSRPATASRLLAHGKQVVSVGFALWPLTATVLFAIGLLVSATKL